MPQKKTLTTLQLIHVCTHNVQVPPSLVPRLQKHACRGDDPGQGHSDTTLAEMTEARPA